jgi:hypothetical protein
MMNEDDNVQICVVHLLNFDVVIDQLKLVEMKSIEASRMKMQTMQSLLMQTS